VLGYQANHLLQACSISLITFARLTLCRVTMKSWYKLKKDADDCINLRAYKV